MSIPDVSDHNPKVTHFKVDKTKSVNRSRMVNVEDTKNISKLNNDMRSKPHKSPPKMSFINTVYSLINNYWYPQESSTYNEDCDQEHNYNILKLTNPYNISKLTNPYDDFLFHSLDTKHIVSTNQNALVYCVNRSFYDHYPLELSPDIIWMAICQGFSIHVNENSEKLRHLFVKHKGQKKLTIHVDELSPDSKDKKLWGKCIDKLSILLDEELKDSIFGSDLLDVKFSTTTSTEMISQKIVWMDCMKRYFSYEISTGCGIPEIYLLGSIDDWKLIRTSIQKMRGFGIDWWIDIIEDVINSFIMTVYGYPDIDFWKSTAQRSGLSASPNYPTTGWIITFFPYIKSSCGTKYIPNNQIIDWKTKEIFVNDEAFPSGQNQLPIKVADLSNNNTCDMLVVSGFLGVEQDPSTMIVRPKIGWGFKKDKN